MDKSVRELELELALYSTRDMLLKAHNEILLRDKGVNDGLLADTQRLLDDLKIKEAAKAMPSALGNEKFTPEQALIISGFTGIHACEPSKLIQDLRTRSGVEDSAEIAWTKELSDLYRADFSLMCPKSNPRSKTKLSIRQAAIVTGYTGSLIGELGDFYRDLEARLGRKIVEAELVSLGQDKISELYKEDFLTISV